MLFTKQSTAAQSSDEALDKWLKEYERAIERGAVSEREQQLADYVWETGLKPLSVHDDSGNCIGTILNCCERGFEAFDADDVLAGVFAGADAAKPTLLDRWYKQHQANGGASTVSEEPGIEPQPFAAAFPMLAAALGLAKQRDWKVFPARMEDGKKWSWLSAKYAPGGENWGMTKDPEQLRRNFLNTKWRLTCGVGVPTGWVNRIFDIEADTKEGHGVDGLASLQGLEAKHGRLPETLTMESPTGSLHRIYNHPGSGIKVISRGLPGYSGVDIKGDGGMFVAPPSVRSDGVYRWLNDAPIADAPQWLIDLVTAKGDGKGQPKELPKIEIAEAFKHLDPNQSLSEGIELPVLQPLPFAPIKAECAWLRRVHDTGGADQSETLWRDALRCCIFLAEGESLIHEFSKEHDGYDSKATEDKFDRARRDKEDKDLGYPRCQTICDHGSEHCKSCPHLDKGKSPLNFGLDAVLDDRVDKDLEELGGTRSPDLRLPLEFCLDEKGQLCAIQRAKKVKGGIQPARLLWLISNRIGAPSLQFQNGHFGIGFAASTDVKGTTEVFLTSTQCYRDHGLLKQLAEKAVMYNPDKPATLMLEKFAVSWMIKLKAEDVAIRDHGTLGWRYRDGGEIVGFVYDDILYHEDGSETSIVRATDDEFYSHYKPAGGRDAWCEAARLLTNRKRPELDIIISIAFAAPLTAFAGTLFGALLSVWGKPGSSKSTAQQVASAVWGNFKQTRESLNSTAKSVQGRLGRIKNLPAFWDDIQDERHQDALFQTMFVATEGAEGGRLNIDASYKIRLEWQTLLAACSNASFVEYLIKKQKSTTAGMRRVFEFEYRYEPDKKDNIEPGIINAHEAGKIFGALEHNFGRIGAEYARMLATEHKAIRVMLDEITEDFMKEVNGSGDENYWWGMCGCLITGAALARRLGAEMDVEAMRAFLIEAYNSNRRIRGTEGTEGGSLANTEQSLAAFLNFYVGGGYVISIDKLFGIRHREVEVLRGPEKGHPIHVQVVRDQRMIIVSKREMREYLEKREIQAKGVFDGLIEYFNAREMKHTLGAGTAHAQAQERCFEIHVQDGQKVLYDILTAQGAPKV